MTEFVLYLYGQNQMTGRIWESMVEGEIQKYFMWPQYSCWQ